MTPLMPMRDALEHLNIFGAILPGESWAAWRVLLIAAMGEELREAERATFAELTGCQNEPGARVEEAWAIVGRRGARPARLPSPQPYLACLVDWRDVLAPGERASLPIISASLWQAQKAYQYLGEIFANVPAPKKLVSGQTADTISLKTRVGIECRPASFRTIRGARRLLVATRDVGAEGEDLFGTIGHHVPTGTVDFSVARVSGQPIRWLANAKAAGIAAAQALAYQRRRHHRRAQAFGRDRHRPGASMNAADNDGSKKGKTCTNRRAGKSFSRRSTTTAASARGSPSDRMRSGQFDANRRSQRRRERYGVAAVASRRRCFSVCGMFLALLRRGGLTSAMRGQGPATGNLVLAREPRAV